MLADYLLKKKHFLRKLTMFAALLVLLLLSSCGISEDSVRIPFSSSDCGGEKYEVVMNQLRDAGFTNIHTIEMPVTFRTPGLVRRVSVDGDTWYGKGDLYKYDVEVIVYYNVKKNEEKPESNSTSLSEDSQSESEKVIQSVDYDKIPYDELQQLFIDLTPDVTPSQLKELAKERKLFFYETSEEGIYQITDTEPKYTAGSYYGKKHGEVFQDYVCVSFDNSTQALEYYFYVNFKRSRSYCEVLYYQSGKYGDVGNVLWNEYMTTDVTGFYINEHGFRADDEENYLDTEFRSDESVPYYYRGTSAKTSLRKCTSAEDCIFRTISWQEILSKPLPSEGNDGKLYLGDVIDAIDESKLQTDELQDFFVSLSPYMKREDLKRALNRNSQLYYSSQRNIFIVTKDSRPQSILSTLWNETGGSPENQDCIVVSFDNSDVGNVLYYAYYYWNEGQGDQQEAIYYRLGEFGLNTTYLNSESMNGNISGFYLYGGLANQENSEHLTRSFKGNDSNPNGWESTSDLEICASAEDAIIKILLYNEAKEMYINKIVTYSTE